MFRLIKMSPARPNKDFQGLFGLHVRSWTIGIGTVHLIFDTIALLCILMLLHASDRIRSIDKTGVFKDYDYEDPPALPTPLSKIDPSNTREQYGNIRDLIIRICYILVTLNMLHGVCRCKPKNLLPFLFFQLSDLFFTFMEVLNYLYFIKSPFIRSDDFPYRQQLNEVPQHKAYVIVALVIFIVLAWKVYAIRLVFRCYKFLMIERHMRTDLPFVITEISHGHMGRGQGNLLPNYNEAIAESLKQSPPSYQAAMAAAAVQSVPPTMVVVSRSVQVEEADKFINENSTATTDSNQEQTETVPEPNNAIHSTPNRSTAATN